MRTGALPLLPAIAALAACATPCGTATPLAPRVAEAVDPRVPVVSPVRSGPVDAQLAARLAALIDQAQSGDAVFRDAAARAEQLAAAAGAAQSESWVAAQQALSAALAARGPTTRALGDIDGLGSTALATRGGISAADMAAIEDASARVAAIDRSQIDRIRAIEARLGS
jgi:hypothetical protein